MSVDWITPIESVRRINVPPDPGIFRALGLNQSFEAALADLVDNSLDAHADDVRIRFILRRGRAVQLLIIDNGSGMDEVRIDSAMKLGRPKERSKSSYGFYGMGLKSASFGQASTLTVMSRGAGAEAQGRRMYREKAGDFEVEVLESHAVERHLSGLLPLVAPAKTGTVVQWDDVRGFPRSKDAAQTDAYLDKEVLALSRHLGMVYHRLLARHEVAITIDVHDLTEGEDGLAQIVNPIDPFGYARTGVPGYPKKLVAQTPHRSVTMSCHLWPARSDSPQYRLYGKPVDSFQGLYLYRNDRLLMAGGWAGVRQENKSYKLARVAVDIDDNLDAFKMSVEKSGVQLTQDLVHAIEQASDGRGTTFQSYLDDAGQAVKEGNAWQPKRTKILPPGQGLDPDVRRTIKCGSPLLEGQEPVRIRWKYLPGSDFVLVDRRNRTLWLNDKYKAVILHGDAGNVNDAPLVKTLLFLLFEDLFRGQAMGPKDKENQQFWTEVLTIAAQAEQKYQ
ncbi:MULTISPECIES: ATP-binding protein [unclassified Mycobacteroides]|uniref:ATP-binding protein n=1 Tax=unclassified Mycobacteroides TaxID=2618759 RepID=UPI00139694EE|nr:MULTISPECIES: ATP-binding protein [unclassified Mycobacteroides]